ncbi:MAG: hypothetical protein RIR41_2000 [Pseudomonadota bacterium]|jgi:hypothetical protein|nr:hypothetical protein [Hyphomonadaceae bacterium]
MSPTRADAIQFLKASIARYRHQLDTLEPSGRSASNVVDFPQPGVDREQLSALIDDARSLLSQLRAG